MPGETLQTKLDAYFQTLSQHAPRSTVRSHKTCIPPFVSFCQSRQISIDIIDVGHVQAFLTSHMASQAITTIKGYIDCLANFVSYVNESDPAIVETQIYHSLADHSPGDEAWTRISVSDSPGLPATDPRFDAVEILIEYLRLRHYGSREHAFAELIRASACRPSIIQQPNLDEPLDRLKWRFHEIMFNWIANNILLVSNKLGIALSNFGAGRNTDCRENIRFGQIPDYLWLKDWRSVIDHANVRLFRNALAQTNSSCMTCALYLQDVSISHTGF